MPRTAAELRELPGVGRYTAGAIASIAYDEPVALLEGNVKRVLARVFAIEASIDDTATVAAMWDAVDALVPRREPGTFNQALMELGSRVCTPRNPQCDTCPVRKWCDAAAQDRAADLPVRRPKKKLAHHQIVAGVLRRNGRYLLGKRRPEGMLGGLWEFPGGKVEPGESHEQALRRELREELGIDTRVGARLASVDHAYTHFKITLNLYTCEHVAGEVAPRYHTELKWVRRRDFDRYAFPAANLKCFDHV
jgi:A/G-specific adenine glycosylase